MVPAGAPLAHGWEYSWRSSLAPGLISKNPGDYDFMAVTERSTNADQTSIDLLALSPRVRATLSPPACGQTIPSWAGGWHVSQIFVRSGTGPEIEAGSGKCAAIGMDIALDPLQVQPSGYFNGTDVSDYPVHFAGCLVIDPGGFVLDAQHVAPSTVGPHNFGVASYTPGRHERIEVLTSGVGAVANDLTHCPGADASCLSMDGPDALCSMVSSLAIRIVYTRN
jgi:hypothetical protein